MFANYKSLVLQDYQRKKAENALSLRLIHPTPAKLKAECILTCDARYRRKDGKVLKDFFGQGDDRTACLQAIEKCDVDKFRPLVNFLRELTGDTEDKNFELLAWLIDFQQRPYEWGKKYDPGEPDIKQAEVRENFDEKEKVLPGQSDGSGKEITSIQPVSGPPASKSKIRITIMAGMILISIGVVIYRAGNNNKKSTVVLTGHEACMYWAGDHYQQVSCSQKLGDTLVIALDSEKLIHFKKITQPDTITERSKGMVWYVKVNGNIEFYTSDGYHPMDSWLRLRPITDYIIRKYIH